ncbi:MAG: DASS family sodium-coupled anion symporter [Candidatus Heimdallarchaeota archaeon]|nr:DASS family sodium-coupled anion symporter [Candidatus Heimdallarchaeota archaeon]MCK4955290.1 DASS family sodium-coupled anion symporter [Candidatus Heimdallarchaeota archaeon]
MFSGKIKKQDAIKIGITIVLLVIAITLSMKFTLGSVAEISHDAKLSGYYDNGITNHTFTLSFSFDLHENESYPEIMVTYFLGDDLRLWFGYSPKVQTGYNKKLIFRVSITDLSNNTADPLPQIGNFSLEISSNSKDGLNLRLPASAIEEDYRFQDWIIFTLRIPYKTNIVLSLLFMVGILWVMEAIPLVATSLLIPIFGVIFLSLSAKGLLAPFAEPVIFLFLGGFIISKAMNKTGLDKWISLNIVRISPNNPKILMLLMMIVTALLSMFMSNTATAATMIPIAVAVTDKLKVNKAVEEEKIDRYGKALVLGIAYSASLGGIGSAIGTPANPIAIALLQEYAGVQITFTQWFVFGLPIVILMLPLMWLYLWIVLKPKVPNESIALAKTAVKKELDNTGNLNKKQIYVLVVFVMALVLWFLEGTIRNYLFSTFSSAIVAIIAAVLLFIPSVLEGRDVNDLNWNAILIFGGGLVLGVVLTQSGTGDLIAFSLENLSFASNILFIALIALVAIILTFIASNTGSASILVPLVIPLGLLFGIDPVLLAVVAAIGSSVDFMLPQGTPPTMIAYSTGKFTIREMVKIGFIVDIFGLLLLSFVLPFFWKLTGIIFF